MTAALPAGNGLALDKPQIRFVHERRGLQGLSRLLVNEFGGGQFSQLVVNERQKLIGGFWIALIDRGQKLCYFAHGNAPGTYMPTGQV